jgi:signal transduction histidine kinase
LIHIFNLSNAQVRGQPLRVELGATAQDDGLVRFWVRDDGSSIPSEARACLFTPFMRLDQVRARGHGLGLSIMRRIVEKLGRQVSVESEGVPWPRQSLFILPGAS